MFEQVIGTEPRQNEPEPVQAEVAAPASDEGGPRRNEPVTLNAEEFTALLLRALVDLAVRSKRRQADLSAALHAAGLPSEVMRVRAALRALRAQGCIENLVPLSDGGLILSVTRLALDRLGPGPRLVPIMPLGDTS